LDAEDVFEVLRRRLQEGSVHHHAGVGDHRVEVAESLDGMRDESIDLVCPADVDHLDVDNAAQQFSGLVNAVAIDISRDNDCPISGEPTSRGSPDAASRSGHDHNDRICRHCALRSSEDALDTSRIGWELNGTPPRESGCISGTPRELRWNPATALVRVVASANTGVEEADPERRYAPVGRLHQQIG
jgi:hypothetical protein